MGFNFEPFTKVGGRFEAKVSIRAKGSIGFSQGAINRFTLENYKAVTLFFDKEARVIGIKPLKEMKEDEPGVMPLVIREVGPAGKRTPTAYLAAKSFMDFYGIDYSSTRSFVAEWNEDHGMIIIDLNKVET